MRIAPVLALLALAACTAPVDVSMARQQLLISDTLPAMNTFPQVRATPPARSNGQMAQDFRDLTFRMESGREVPVMTRFDGPITVALTGLVPATATTDLAQLLARFRTEAGIDITQTTGPASITVEFLPRERLQAVVPAAACFVVPRVTTFGEYRRARASSRVDWTTLTTRDQVAIFVPSDTSPQEVRDCLHEEMAQALGPLNDLYRLSDSVFNDDNFHTVLTGFDMLMLRAYYAPELRSGMTEAQVAAVLPALLARLNPAGQRPGGPADKGTPRAWIDAVETALGPRTASVKRRDAARVALSIAKSQGWTDSRLAFSYFALGRLSLGNEIETAVTSFAEAARIYRSLPGGRIHAAHVDMQMAAFALSSGQATEAVMLTDHAIPAVRAAENAALLATLLMIRSEALFLLNRDTEARAARLDSLGWARYGFGSEIEVRARMSEIAVLAPVGNNG